MPPPVAAIHPTASVILSLPGVVLAKDPCIFVETTSGSWVGHPLTHRMDNVYTLSMDVLYRYEGLEFVWDVHKAASNIEKHGIRFEQACEVFLDPLARLVDAGVEDEARDALLGEVAQGKLLFVVHIERESEAIRIISARAATATERKDYEDYA